MIIYVILTLHSYIIDVFGFKFFQMKVEIWAIRHAPTIYNIQKKLQGQVDTNIDLTRSINYFENLNVRIIPQPEIIVVSGLKRTKQTAVALIKYLSWSKKIQIISDARLNERKLGIMEGLTVEQIKQLMISGKIKTYYPNKQINELISLSPILEAPGFRIDQAETMEEVAVRVGTGLLEIVRATKASKYLWINHYGGLKSLGLAIDEINHFVLNSNDLTFPKRSF